jgi:DNA-binding transcriptional MerR regulator
MIGSWNIDIGVKVKPDGVRGAEGMRIGVLAQLTETSPRLLRYYEEQGLIGSQRLPNGYRDYEEPLVDRVLQIRGLLAAGLPTRIIRQLLPCLSQPQSLVFDDATPEVLAMLEQERDRMTQRIGCLARNRDAVSAYLAEVCRRRAA